MRENVMPAMSLETFRAQAGFNVDGLIKQIKDELGVGKVRVIFDNYSSQAMSRHGADGVLEVHLPSIQTILQQRPELTREEAIAKIKAQVAEELCHGKFHETAHNEQVVSCTIKEMREHMSQSELTTSYIAEKIRRLQGAQTVVVGTPLGPVYRDVPR